MFTYKFLFTLYTLTTQSVVHEIIQIMGAHISPTKWEFVF